MKKRVIIKAIVSVVVFVISVIIISSLMNHSSLDMTVEMSKATLPLAHIVYDGKQINEMRGYTDEMDVSSMRDAITPLTDNRSVEVSLDMYGRVLKSLSYEIRSVDGQRLVESTEVFNYVDQGSYVTATLEPKDLMEAGNEYALVLIATLEDGQQVRYYTRIIELEGCDIAQRINFALDFSAKTFDKTAARELAKYMESNADGDNTTYSRVDIHSSFSQITWGDLQVSKKTEPLVKVKTLDPLTASIELTYLVNAIKDEQIFTYNVTECFRVRSGQERMFLLDYERTMDEQFNWNASVFVNNKIMLGITNPDVHLVQSDGGSVVAFVQESRLYCYLASTGKIAYVFGFYDDDNYDARTLQNDFGIRILNVDETGNVRFMVFGYMSRGSHEGRVGIQIFTYNSTVNTIEEEVFIPCDKPYQMLKEEVNELAYVNNSNQLYLVLNGGLYCVDLEAQSYRQIVSNLMVDSYKVSESNRVIVWQDSSALQQCESLKVMDFNTQRTTTIDAPPGEYVKPIGFMGEDIIYGLAKKSDLAEDASGKIIFPMYSIKIQDDAGNLLKDYNKDGYYVIDAQIEDNQINLNRVTKSSDLGTFVAAKDDQIMDNDETKAGSNLIEVAVTQDYEKIVQIALKDTIPTDKLKRLTPKQVLYEGGREISIPKNEERQPIYYIYNMHGIVDSCRNVSEAVRLAESLSSVVVADNGYYIWQKGTRLTKNQIMKIQPEAENGDKNSVAVCLDAILKYEGVSKSSELQLKNGKRVVTILQDGLEDKQVLDLSGCSLDSVLYYVNQDIPVLAMLSDGSAVLIVGFNELNTVIMDPKTGTIYKKGMNDSKDFFERNGNCFITYMK